MFTFSIRPPLPWYPQGDSQIFYYESSFKPKVFKWVLNCNICGKEIFNNITKRRDLKSFRIFAYKNFSHFFSFFYRGKAKVKTLSEMRSDISDIQIQNLRFKNKLKYLSNFAFSLL